MVETDHTIKLICIFYIANLFGIALELLQISLIDFLSYQSLNHLLKQKPSKRESWKIHHISKQRIASTVYFIPMLSWLLMLKWPTKREQELIDLSRSYIYVWISMSSSILRFWFACLTEVIKKCQKTSFPSPPPISHRVVRNLSKSLLSNRSMAVFSVKPLLYKCIYTILSYPDSSQFWTLVHTCCKCQFHLLVILCNRTSLYERLGHVIWSRFIPV